MIERPGKAAARSAARRRIGRWLRERGRLCRAEGAALARRLQVPERTLRSWRLSSYEGPLGRPPHAAEVRAAALERVQAALETVGTRQSWRGALEQLAVLGERIPAKLVQESTSAIKAARRARAEEHRRERCTRVQVLEPGVLCSADTTDMGRSVEGVKCEAAAVKDVCTRELLAASVGGPVDAEKLIELVESAGEQAGGLPLVLALDNGGPQRSEALSDWAVAHEVVLLFNVPRVPQHNAWIERGFGELKAEAGLGGGEALLWPQEPVLTREERRALPWKEMCSEVWRRVERARVRLNTELRRPCLGGRTAAELDRIRQCPEDRARRARFYAACQSAVDAALQGLDGSRARRRAEREAIWCTMERYGLVTRTRGGRPLQPTNSAGLS